MLIHYCILLYRTFFFFFSTLGRKVREKATKLLESARREDKVSAALLSGLAQATSAEDLEAVSQSAELPDGGGGGRRRKTLAARAVEAGLEEAALAMLDNSRSGERKEKKKLTFIPTQCFASPEPHQRQWGGGGGKP